MSECYDGYINSTSSTSNLKIYHQVNVQSICDIYTGGLIFAMFTRDFYQQN